MTIPLTRQSYYSREQGVNKSTEQHNHLSNTKKLQGENEKKPEQQKCFTRVEETVKE